MTTHPSLIAVRPADGRAPGPPGASSIPGRRAIGRRVRIVATGRRNPGYTGRGSGGLLTYRTVDATWRIGSLVRREGGELQQFEDFERNDDEPENPIRHVGIHSSSWPAMPDEVRFAPTTRRGTRFAHGRNRDETRTGPSRSSWIDRIASCSNRFTYCARFTLNLRLRRFSTAHVVYIRGTAKKRCQWKGNRPRGGFRLPLGAVPDESLGWLGSGNQPPRSRLARWPRTRFSKQSRPVVEVGGGSPFP